MADERTTGVIFPLIEEELHIGNRTVPSGVRTEGDVVIVPVLEEVLVIEKRLVLKEELHVRRQATRETVEVPVTLRKQQGVVERLSAKGHPHPHPEEDLSR